MSVEFVISNQHHQPIKGKIIAVLDKQMTAKTLYREADFYVNWFVFKQLFDFDQVEIINANSEDIERFAIQVANDTDPTRTPLYPQMSCVISWIVIQPRANYKRFSL